MCVTPTFLKQSSRWTQETRPESHGPASLVCNRSRNEIPHFTWIEAFRTLYPQRWEAAAAPHLFIAHVKCGLSRGHPRTNAQLGSVLVCHWGWVKQIFRAKSISSQPSWVINWVKLLKVNNRLVRKWDLLMYSADHGRETPVQSNQWGHRLT